MIRTRATVLLACLICIAIGSITEAAARPSSKPDTPPYGETLTKDVQKGYKLVTEGNRVSIWFTLNSSFTLPGAWADKGQLDSKIADVLKSGGKAPDVDRALKSTAASFDYPIKGGPFTVSEAKAYAEVLRASAFTLVAARWHVIETEGGGWYLQTIYPDALQPASPADEEGDLKEEDMASVRKVLEEAFSNQASQSGGNQSQVHDEGEEEAVPTPASGSPQAEPQAPEEVAGEKNCCEYFKHTVVVGDTLSGLAQKYCGDPKLWQALNSYNFGDQSGTRIDPGQVLTVPPCRELRGMM